MSDSNKTVDGTEVSALLAMNESLRSERSNWESLWQDVADFVCPVRSSISTKKTRGGSRVTLLSDGTAIRANERFASGLFGYMCRPDEQWFKMYPINPALKEDEEVQFYFNSVQRIIHKNLYLSNFSQEIHEDFLDLGAFGTSNLYIEAGDEYPLHFRNVQIRNYAISESAHGMIDVCFHQFELTNRQAVQKFGLEAVSEDVRNQYENPDGRNINKKRTYLHVVMPRRSFDSNKIDDLNMPFASYYIDVKAKKLIKESGYRDMPYIVSRFMKDPDEVYGRSPAITCLPEIKSVNSMKFTLIRAASKRTDPPMAIADNSIIGAPKLDPGSLVYVRGAMFQDRPVPIDTKSDVGVGMEMIQQEQQAIKEAFYTDMFDALLDRKYMTATEVETRKQQQMILFAPMLARVQTEKLSRIVQRSYNILFDMGLFPELPDALKENPHYEIQFVGKMALAMRALDTFAIQSTLGMVENVAQIDPSVLDNFNFNAMLRDTAINNGMNQAFIYTDEEVQATRERKQELAKQQAEMQMAQQGADVVNKLQKPTEEGSPLDNLASQA